MDQAQAYAQLINVAGGVAALADEMGLTRNAIYAWNGVIPEPRLDDALAAARRIRARAGKLPSKRELRPDLFTPKPRGAGRGNAKNGETRGKEKSVHKEKDHQTAEG